mgnify:CR=1 FL=1
MCITPVRRSQCRSRMKLATSSGSRHDRHVDATDTPFAYGHGHVNGEKWRDVMSYNGGCGGCPRIAHFSNPRVNYKDEAHRHRRRRQRAGHSRVGPNAWRISAGRPRRRAVLCALLWVARRLELVVAELAPCRSAARGSRRRRCSTAQRPWLTATPRLVQPPQPGRRRATGVIAPQAAAVGLATRDRSQLNARDLALGRACLDPPPAGENGRRQTAQARSP